MTDVTTNTADQAQDGKPANGSTSSGNGAGGEIPVMVPVSAATPKAPEEIVVPPPEATRSSEGATEKPSVAGIKLGDVDGRNIGITRIFYKFEEYAIYLSGDEVRIQYGADKEAQIEKLAELVPLRERLQYLADKPQLKKRYLPQIADAFFLALQDKKECAKQVLDEAEKDIRDVRTREGRIVYVKCAIALGIGLAALLFILGHNAFDKAQVGPLWLAAGSGSIGALLSIAIALRGRSVATDGDWQTNMVDVTIRILIGVISAAVLYLLLSSGIMPNIQVGEMSVSGAAITWQVALVIGFLAGFVERLVPDLLEKKAPAPAQTT